MGLTHLSCSVVFLLQIVNDRSVRGKCYGFVTFSNRRSADDAIEDMDGKVWFFVLFVVFAFDKP